MLIQPRTMRAVRICFRTSRAVERQVDDLAMVSGLPRSAVVFLLVQLALASLSNIMSREQFWSAVGSLPLEDLRAAAVQALES